jgi:hypothetical protein
MLVSAIMVMQTLALTQCQGNLCACHVELGLREQGGGSSIQRSQLQASFDRGSLEVAKPLMNLIAICLYGHNPQR